MSSAERLRDPQEQLSPKFEAVHARPSIGGHSKDRASTPPVKQGSKDKKKNAPEDISLIPIAEAGPTYFQTKSSKEAERKALAKNTKPSEISAEYELEIQDYQADLSALLEKKLTEKSWLTADYNNFKAHDPDSQNTRKWVEMFDQAYWELQDDKKAGTKIRLTEADRTALLTRMNVALTMFEKRIKVAEGPSTEARIKEFAAQQNKINSPKKKAENNRTPSEQTVQVSKPGGGWLKRLFGGGKK